MPVRWYRYMLVLAKGHFALLGVRGFLRESYSEIDGA